MINEKPSAAPGPAPKPAAALPPPVPPSDAAAKHASPRLFRRTDWLTFFLTFTVVWVIYFLTLGPEVTLEDSGELVTGSMYAGIPHAPGYPVWAIYSWLWTVLLPFGNMAWRVAIGQAFSGAVACGLLGMMVSRGSSMFIEGIEALKAIPRKWENAICVVSGFAAGALVGLDRFVWSESVVVNRIAVFSMPWVMLVLLCLMRWLYTPSQMRYAYLAAFLFGICLTIHQSLVVAALAIEVFIALGNPRMGRNAFLGNFFIYAAYMTVYLARTPHVHLLANISRPGMFVVFNIVGLGSLLAGVWLTVVTRDILKGWLHVIGMFALFWLGLIAFYLYMPVSCMTNPPMEWCYPRTVDGFVHAITRGQYEQPNPTDVISEFPRFISQLGALLNGLNHEFTWSLLLFALVPFLFLFRMQKRERSWLIGLASMYVCLGVLLTILLNPSPGQGSENLMRVFFTSSHTIVALLIGYGLALTVAYMAAQYERFRLWGAAGGTIAVVLALYNLVNVTGEHYFGPDGHWAGLGDFVHLLKQAFAKDQYGLPIFGALVLVGLLAAFVVSLGLRRRQAPLLLALAVFAALPLYSTLSHWGLSEQKDHWYGYWFGHDMFTPPFKGADGQPLYPEMERNAILFGGTDPGRFCPTYMIFCDSFTPHDCLPDPMFDRRDVYLITQNALVDPPYLNYIRAQYNRSAQKDPPFFTELLHTRLAAPLDSLFSWWGDKVEKKRRTYTSWFTDADFTNLPGLAAKLRPGPAQGAVSKYIYERLSPETSRLLAETGKEASLRRSLATDLNRLLESGPLYDPARFEGIVLSPYLKDFVRENPQSHTRIRLNRLLLEAAYPDELAKSPSAIYPDREIYTPTFQDKDDKIQEYLADVSERYRKNQLDPGESVTIANGGLLQVNNQFSIMAMNGLVAKVIFDKNPNNEFYVEESLPLKWMYPHLSPFGIIMKVNRQPLPEITEEMVRRDHEFWCQYSQRFIGNWITYETSVEDLIQWIEKVYLQHNFAGFKGDRKFIMDNQAQNAFSKLRSAIGGIYTWRVNDPNNHDGAVQQRMLNEADFAYRQAFAFSPTSPEAVSHFVSILATRRHFADARRVVQVALKLDPSGSNGYFQGLLDQIDRWYYQEAFDQAAQMTQAHQPALALLALDRVLTEPKASSAAFRTLLKAYADLQAYTNVNATEKLQAAVARMKAAVEENPLDAEAVFALADGLRYLKDASAADEALDALLFNRKADATAILLLAQEYAKLGNLPRTEAALQRHAALQPQVPEGWYDLAAIKAVLGKKDDALSDLRRALSMSAQRSQKDPAAKDLFQELQHDARFDSLRQVPAFQQLVTPPK